MSYMFLDAAAFNQDISAWDTVNVTDMSQMFGNATSFNQDLTGWCVTNTPVEPGSFAAGATAWSPSLHPVWGTCPP